MPQYMRNPPQKQEKPPSMRRRDAMHCIVDLLAMAAAEAPNRNAAERLRAAAACVCDALAYEREALQ